MQELSLGQLINQASKAWEIETDIAIEDAYFIKL